MTSEPGRPGDGRDPVGKFADSGSGGGGGSGPARPSSESGDDLEHQAEIVEELIAEVVGEGDQSAEEAVAEAVGLARRFEAERDEYLDHLRRLQAEFENYKRRVDSQRIEQRAQAAMDLVRELLPVLDACDAALSHGHEHVEPIRTQLLQTLQKQGLVPVAESGVPFDPNVHEAVMHEEGEGEAVVSEVLRSGYLWNERVVRAAMVKVRG